MKESKRTPVASGQQQRVWNCFIQYQSSFLPRAERDWGTVRSSVRDVLRNSLPMFPYKFHIVQQLEDHNYTYLMALFSDTYKISNPIPRLWIAYIIQMSVTFTWTKKSTSPISEFGEQNTPMSEVKWKDIVKSNCILRNVCELCYRSVLF